MVDCQNGVSRRNFLAGAVSCLGVIDLITPLPVLAAELARDSRIAQTPIIDKGFASVRKIGRGLYATISDPSKGTQTTCNGGFLVGKDAALLIEGFNSPAGASFQFDALRMVSQVAIKGALDTHYHYDHSMGNSFYGARGVPLWAHAAAAKRIVDAYAPMQGVPVETVLSPYEKHINEATSDLVRAHAQSDLDAMRDIFAIANANVLALPNCPLDPAQLPLSIDLSHLIAILECYPGHSGTDIVVRVPEQNVVYTGDLLYQGKYPVCFDEQATIFGWRETLKKFAAFDKDTIFVPGHGQICSQEGIATIREIFDDIEAQAEKMHRAGVPLEDAQHLYVVPDRFKGFAIWSWGFVIGSAITLLYGEWRARKS
jgi:glyoxylase-like metal-dependent hydrolase (beta-lactamase superfamily II)